MLDTPLIRLQCYEGIDAAEALYEWNYPRQLLGIRLAEVGRARRSARTTCSAATTSSSGRCCGRSSTPGPGPAVLLIDEVDRADDEFEAFLFELLAESAVTIPELGTLRAAHPPVVVLTSNRTRDLHDALKRRCLYHWIDYPTLDRAVAIIRRRVPARVDDARRAGRRRRCSGCARSTSRSRPGIAEAINWVAALDLLGLDRARRRRRRADARLGAQVPRGPRPRPRARPGVGRRG